MRVGAVLGGICTVLIAGAAGAGLYSGFGFHTVAAIAVAGAVLAGLGLYHGMSRAIGLRTVVTRQLHDLSRGESDLARQVAQIDRRVADLESRFEAALDRTRVATDPLALELGDLGVLVKELAAKVGVHESALNELVQPQAVQPSRLILETRPAAPTKPAEPAAAGETPKGGGEEILATVGSGIDGNRGELCLLPIVSLPQRKIRYYEARLGNEPHERLTPADLPAHGKREGALPNIDRLAIARCVEVVRRLRARNREIALFCSISGSTLKDTDSFRELLELMDANRAIASAIVLEFAQPALRAAGPVELESLAALIERGFRFCLGQMTDLRIEPGELAIRGFRFIKIPAKLLLNRATAAIGMHPAELSDLLARFAIDLIVEKIDSEAAVIDLLDYDVRFGQGPLFSPARPLRVEALQAVAEPG